MEQHQGRRSELAAVFGYPGVAGAYRYRPPYPAEVFEVLERIITDRPRRVLDIGAGEGALGRPLARRVDQVDAVEISAAMVATGRRRPGGDHPALRWITGAAEDAPLGGPYALVTAGASLHWMPWRPTLTRLAAAMTGHAYMASYVEHFHSTSSLARELMPGEDAAAFDRAVAGLVRPHATDGLLDLPVVADLAWGRITVTAAR
jgi:trans-aconitate methyltransferase